MSGLNEMDLVVFKPGYDSHPPAIRRKMEKPENNKYPTTDGKYHVGKFAHCKIWRKCKVKLNKAISLEERRQASNECRNSLNQLRVDDDRIAYISMALRKAY
jgi:hypothetical protein